MCSSDLGCFWYGARRWRVGMAGGAMAFQARGWWVVVRVVWALRAPGCGGFAAFRPGGWRRGGVRRFLRARLGGTRRTCLRSWGERCGLRQRGENLHFFFVRFVRFVVENHRVTVIVDARFYYHEDTKTTKRGVARGI